MPTVFNIQRLAVFVLSLSCGIASMQPALFAAEIIAHRGASFDAPENTRASVELAWEQNSDAVELDVYLTSDNKIVAIHDKTPKRYGGPDRPVEEMSWEELKSLDVGAWKDPRWKGVTVPLLSELLPLTPDGKRVFIEIKSGPKIVPHLKKVLQELALPQEKLVVIAFSEEVCKAVREQIPSMPVYWLVSVKQDKQTGALTPTAEQIIQTAQRLNVPGVDVGGVIQQDLVQKVLDANLEFMVWTINDPARAKELVNWGAIGITTDKPALMLQELKANSRKANTGK